MSHFADERLFQKIILSTFVALSISLVLPGFAKAAPMAVTGYAWASAGPGAEMGAISFSSTNNSGNNGATYGVFEDSVTGYLSGQAAMSNNLGYISFNASHVSGCPGGGTCAPRVNPGTGVITGWARACSAFVNKTTCSGGLDPNSGGWDGFIALRGTATDGTVYGVTRSTTSCAWSGFGWGSDAFGAIRFDGVVTDCAPSVTLTASPASIDAGQSSTLTWSSTNADYCDAPGSFSGGATANGATSGSASTGALTANASYQINCYRGGVSAQDVATVTVVQPQMSITPSTTRVVVPITGPNPTISVSWNVSNVTSCTLQRNGTAIHTITTTGVTRSSSGTMTDITIDRQTVFSLSCRNNAGPIAQAATATVNITSSFKEF